MSQPARCTSTAATCSTPARSSWPAGCPGATFRSTVSSGSWAREYRTVPRAARRPPCTGSTSRSSVPVTPPARRRCSSRRYARSVTILCRGTNLEKSMSRYLVDQLATRSNVSVTFGAEVAAVHGELSLEAIDIKDVGHGRGDPARVRRPLHLHRRGCRDGLAAGRDRTRPKRFRADRLRCGRRRERPARSRPLPAGDERPGIFACGDVRFGPVKRVAAAVGEGSMAIAFVHQYLKDE